MSLLLFIVRINSKMNKFIIFYLMFVYPLAANAQMDDSVLARRHQLQGGGERITVTVSDRFPALQVSPEWNQSQAECSNGYQNRTTSPVTLYIAATFGHSNVTWAFSRRSLAVGWVNIAFTRDGGTTSAIIPPGYIFCVTTNSSGEYWAAYTPGGVWNYQVVFWEQQPVPPGSIYVDANTGACYEAVAIRRRRVEVNGEIVIVTEYVVRHTINRSESVLPEVSFVPAASLPLGACGRPPSEGGDQ